MRTSLAVRIAALAALATVSPLAAQSAATHNHGDRMPLYGERLGSYTWPVTTTSPTAQAYFDQGVRLMYAYTPGGRAALLRGGAHGGPAVRHVLVGRGVGRWGRT
jgi:hypothetical protein